MTRISAGPGLMAVLLIGLLVAGFSRPGWAEPGRNTAAGTGGGAQHEVAVITVVRARDLMSAADRQAYRQAMRQARDEAARQRIRESVLNTVRERAAEHGVVMIIETRAPHVGPRRSEREPVRPPLAP